MTSDSYVSIAKINLERHQAVKGVCWRCTCYYRQHVPWPCFPYQLAAFILNR